MSFKAVSLLTLLTLSVPGISLAQSKPSVFIVEYDGVFQHHGQNIEDIGCSSQNTCETVRLQDFEGPLFQSLRQSLRNSPRDAVNFSFILQRGEKPTLQGRFGPAEIAEALKDYEAKNAVFNQEVNNLEALIDENPQTLFAIAAGNGFNVVGLQTKGVALGQQFELFPAKLQKSNTIVVAALEEGRRDLLAEYSNYGLTTVDVAAPVLANRQNEILQGTSYAAPFVAKLTTQLKQLGDFSPAEIKEILLKSCEVPKIKESIAASIELNSGQSNSRTFRAMYDKKRKNRNLLQQELGSIVMVKCGGALSEDLALTCARNYINTQRKVGITESCLQSHEAHGTNLRPDLLSLWKVRGMISEN